MPPSLKKILWNVVKTLVIILPFFWISRQVRLPDLLGALARFDAAYIAPIILIFVMQMYVLQSLRWWILVRAFFPAISYLHVLILHTKGVFYSIVLPTTAAQDIVRAVLLLRKNSADYDYKTVWGSTGVSKLLGVIAPLICSLCGLIVLFARLPVWVYTVAAVSAVILCLVSMLLFTKRLTRIIRLWIERLLPGNRIVKVIGDIREGIYLFKAKKGAVLVSFAVTLAMALLGIFNAALIFKGVTGRFYFIEALTFLPLIEIMVISLPITPNGIGVRDALLLFLLNGFLKLPPEQSGAFILIALAAHMLRLLGCIPLIFEGVGRMLQHAKPRERHRSSDAE